MGYLELSGYKRYLDIVMSKDCNLKFINQDYNRHKNYIDKILVKNIKTFYDIDNIYELIHYGIKNGKRIRSIIISSIYEKYYNIDINDVNNTQIGELISSIEYTQSASLILDDIMDHDKYRRDELCMYLKYGSNKTQLTALILLSRSYKNISTIIMDLYINYNLDDKEEKINNHSKLCERLFNNFEECAIGQYLDLYGNKDLIDEVLMKKTVTLFEIPYLIIWTYISWDKPNLISSDIKLVDIENVSKYMGLLFQIADDFTDIERDKTNKSKFNYILNQGIENAYKKYMYYMELWKDISKKLKFDTDVLSSIVEYLTLRTQKIYNQYII